MEGADGGWLWWWGVGGDGFVPAEEGGEGEAAGEEHCCLLFGPGEGCCLLLKFLSCPWWLWSAFVRLVCREVQVSRRGNFGVAATSSVFFGGARQLGWGESVRFIPSPAVQVRVHIPHNSNVTNSRHRQSTKSKIHRNIVDS